MTRPEYSNNRDLTFSGWIRQNLPDSSTGFMVSDLDFILFNYKTKKAMLLEIKQHGKKISTWQRNLFKWLHQCIQRGSPVGWKYLGMHLVTFERSSFQDGDVWFDRQIVTEEQLKKFLSF